MMAAQSVLSSKAAMIARKIPRIEPLLRMIEENGFEVIGFEAAPAMSKPVLMVNTSPGSRALYKLLERRGYQVALSDPPEKTGAVRNEAEPAFRTAVSV